MSRLIRNERALLPKKMNLLIDKYELFGLIFQLKVLNKQMLQELILPHRLTMRILLQDTLKILHRLNILPNKRRLNLLIG